MAVSVIQVSLQTGEDICPSFCRGSAVVFLILFCFCGSGRGQSSPALWSPLLCSEPRGGQSPGSAGKGGLRAPLTTQGGRVASIRVPSPGAGQQARLLRRQGHR